MIRHQIKGEKPNKIHSTVATGSKKLGREKKKIGRKKKKRGCWADKGSDSRLKGKKGRMVL